MQLIILHANPQMNWYSKRALLAGVYTTTELYMTQDDSEDFVETWRFLDRRLNDVAALGKATDEIRNIVNFATKSLVGIMTSVG